MIHTYLTSSARPDAVDTDIAEGHSGERSDGVPSDQGHRDSDTATTQRKAWDAVIGIDRSCSAETNGARKQSNLANDDVADPSTGTAAHREQVIKGKSRQAAIVAEYHAMPEIEFMHWVPSGLAPNAETPGPVPAVSKAQEERCKGGGDVASAKERQYDNGNSSSLLHSNIASEQGALQSVRNQAYPYIWKNVTPEEIREKSRKKPAVVESSATQESEDKAPRWHEKTKRYAIYWVNPDGRRRDQFCSIAKYGSKPAAKEAADKIVKSIKDGTYVEPPLKRAPTSGQTGVSQLHGSKNWRVRFDNKFLKADKVFYVTGKRDSHATKLAAEDYAAKVLLDAKRSYQSRMATLVEPSAASHKFVA